MALEHKKIAVSIGVPKVFSLTGEWEPNTEQKQAAWEIYIELVTRISVVELQKDEGIVREALSSLHSLFAEMRSILKKYGPAVAKQSQSDLSLGYITVRILNEVLRPFLSKWHPRLLAYEEMRKEEDSLQKHYKEWEDDKAAREELNFLSKVLYQYSKILAEAAGINPLVTREESE